jgi:hypothetical protein
MFKKAANLFMSCTDNEEDLSVHLDHLNWLLVFMESQPAVIRLFNWLHMSARFYYFMKREVFIKARTTVFKITEKNSETVQMLMVFPVKYFTQLDIKEVIYSN